MNESIDEVKSGVFAWFLALMDSSSSSHGLTSAVYEWGRWKDEYDGPEQGSSSSSSSSFARANVGIRQLTTLSDKHVSMVACGLSHSVALSGTRARVSARQRRPPSTVKLTLTIRARTHTEYGDVYTWGWAGGHENATYQDSPMPIKRFMLIKALHNVRVKLICASDQHTLALAGTPSLPLDLHPWLSRSLDRVSPESPRDSRLTLC